jgi:hypothetical protein
MYFSCNDSEKSGHGTPYDPNKPVVIETFSPDSGGMATKLFITGRNFGNDPAAIKVYYNDKLAPVVGADGEHIYAITPRQPGEFSDIAVVVGNDSVIAGKQFKYRIQTTVTTLAGKKGTTSFSGGSLAEATFQFPYYLAIDDEDNIFVCHWRIPYVLALINEEKDLVQSLYTEKPLTCPIITFNGWVLSQSDTGDVYYTFDPQKQWEPKANTIEHPTAADIANGMPDFFINWKKGGAQCLQDNCVYTIAYSGDLVKFNLLTKKGQQVASNALFGKAGQLAFDPFHPNMLYIAPENSSSIYSFDINTKELKLYAGTTEMGYRDGPRLEAQFNWPEQLAFDEDGAIVITDRKNHCIRKISPEGIVSTVAGKPGQAGYQDGDPDEAMFHDPTGLAISKNYDIYVADYENNCIRKISIQ